MNEPHECFICPQCGYDNGEWSDEDVANAEGFCECDRCGTMIAPPTDRQRNSAAILYAMTEAAGKQLAHNPKTFFTNLPARRYEIINQWYGSQS